MLPPNRCQAEEPAETVQRFVATLASLDDVVFALDPQGRLLDCRQPPDTHFFPSEALIGEHFSKLFPPAATDILGQAFTTALTGQRAPDFEYSMEAGGAATWWNAKVVTLRDRQGVVSGIAFVNRDVTQCKQQEAKVQRLYEILEGRLEQLSGPTAVLTDLRLGDILDLAELQAIQDAFSAATGVASIITEIDGTPITRPSNFCELCADIIRKSEGGPRNCFHSAAVLGRRHPAGPVMQPCLSGGLWDAGTSICVGDLHIANWLVGQVRDEHSDDEEMMAYGREIGADETAYRAALAKVPRMAHARFVKICDALHLIGNQLSKLAYQNIQQARFVAERQRLESELRQAQKLEAVGQLASGIAHDFNNILTAQLMTLSLLQGREDLSTEARESIEVLESGAHMAADLTQQLLAFSSRQVLQLKRIDLNEVIAHLMKMLSRLLGEDIQLTCKTSAPPQPVIDGDFVMIEQIVMNLVINARDAMPQGGTINIHTDVIDLPDDRPLSHPEARPGRFARMKVSDNGCGMDKKTLQHIFEPFYTTKEKGKGTGLGLATIHGIVQQHKGWIEVESRPGHGSIFIVSLPIATSQPQKETSTLVPPEASDQGENETILIVEDDLLVRETIAGALRRLGHQVREADNGRNALRLWSECRNEVRLVITDMVMPDGMNGLELVEHLRRDNPDLAVILSSGYRSQEIQTGLTSSSDILFLSKPFSIDLLSATINQAIGRRVPRA